MSKALATARCFLYFTVSPTEEQICRNCKQFGVEGADQEDKILSGQSQRMCQYHS